jgi:lysophospholipase L1-like esterase
MSHAMHALLALLAVSIGVFTTLFVLRRVFWLPYVWAPAIAAIASRRATEGEVVFTGSSSITFWSTLPRDMAPLRAVNCGFGGSMIAHATHYLPRIAPVRPSAVVLSAGSNDVAWGKSAERVAADLDAFVARLHALHPGVPLYFVSINRAPSRRSSWGRFDAINAHARSLAARDPLVRYIDASAAIYDASGLAVPGTFGFDRLHMTPDGYRRWTRVIQPRLLADLPAARA